MHLSRHIWLAAMAAICLILSACRPITAPMAAHVAQTGETPAFAIALGDSSKPTRNRPFKIVFDGIPEVENPFDPTQADLQVSFFDPSGREVNIGAFWYQPFAPESDLPSGPGSWRAIFTPTASGEWRAFATFRPSGLRSNELRFMVEEGDAPGFIRIDPMHPRFFAYDDGSRFLPIGINMGWWEDDPIADYTLWLDHLAANGGNTIRVWMANWAFGLEWNDTPLGNYGARMRQAWLLDEVLRLADERGIKVILVLNHHGQFSRSVNPQWDDNPYNADQGGPLSAPEQFVTDPTAIALFQQRLRYIVDRWGSAPNLLAWEWWNEYNFTPITDAQMEAWIQNMDTFLTARDPYDHLVTISGPAGPESPVWQLPGIDFVSVHIYSTSDPLQFASELSAEYTSSVQDKPLLLAEFGYATGEETVDSFDKSGIHLHNGLWATLFSGQAGSGMYWWWDTYVEPLNLWPNYGSIARYFESIDLALFTPAPLSVTGTGKQSDAEGLLLTSDEMILFWVRSKGYTALSVDEAHNAAVRNALRNRQTLTEWAYQPPPVSGHTVEISNIPEGNYRVQWFDPQLGQWGSSEEIDIKNGTLMIPLPAFNKDIAARITRLP